MRSFAALGEFSVAAMMRGELLPVSEMLGSAWTRKREREKADKKVERDVVAKEGREEEQQNEMQRERCAQQ